MARSASSSTDALRDLILRTLDDGKAEEIATIDLAGKSSMADYMIVASGRSSRKAAVRATGCWSMPATWSCICSGPKSARSTILKRCGAW
jgi:hypothetical protein